jgi:MIP family channel proteins
MGQARAEVDVWNEWYRPLIVEFIGPFTLTFAGVGAIILSGDIVAIALAHGLAIGLMVAAAGHISGGHYNPAVTLGLLAGGKITPPKALAYIAAQLLGAVVAALLLIVAFDKALWDPVNLGTPQPGSGVSNGQALLLEAVMTFFLMFVIYGVAVDHRSSKAVPGLLIGLTITMDIFLGGGSTGAAMNPSRAFGPALVAWEWDDHYIYWIAPIFGAAVAGLLWAYVLLTPETEAHAGHAPGTPD